VRRPARVARYRNPLHRRLPAPPLRGYASLPAARRISRCPPLSTTATPAES
jgi:hypothetical protein